MSLLLRTHRFICSQLFLQPKYVRHIGYVVLLPEIGEDVQEKVPLINAEGLPDFTRCTVEHCMTAIAQQSLDYETTFKVYEEFLETKQGDIFRDFIEPFQMLSEQLHLSWGLTKLLYMSNASLMPTKTFTAIRDRYMDVTSMKYSSPTIYKLVLNALEKKDHNYSPDQLAVLNRYATASKLNGLDLVGRKRSNYLQYMSTIKKEMDQFNEKTIISTNVYTLVIGDTTVVSEFPIYLLRNITADPEHPYKGPWKFSIGSHVYDLLMEYCPKAGIRHALWHASVNRGTTQTKEIGTTSNVIEIRYAQQRAARLLNYRSHMEMVLNKRMINSVDTIDTLFREILNVARPVQSQELKSLYQFAKKRGFTDDRIQQWDVTFWTRKQKLALFNYKEDLYRQYFELNRVLEGLYQLCNFLYGIEIQRRQEEVSTWKKNVWFYDIYENGNRIGGIYLDAYAESVDRKCLTGYGSVINLQNGSKFAGTKPLVAIILNFEPPDVITYQSSLLSIEEVEMVFRSFGDALQHILANSSQYSDVFGLMNCEWDAMPINGKFLAHFVYNPEMLERIARHYKSLQRIPEKLRRNMLKCRTHMAATKLCKRIYWACLDIELHQSDDYWLDIVRRIWPQILDYPIEREDWHPLSFTQSMSEEWGGSIYTSVWTDIVAAHLYQLFEEAKDDPIRLKNMCKQYRDTLLGQVGIRPYSDMFIELSNGHNPNVTPLLKTLGIMH